MLWHTNSKLSNQGFKIHKKKENWGMQRKWRDRDWRPWERPPWKQHMSSIPGLNRTRRFSVCLTVKKRVTNVEGTEEGCWRDWRNQPLKLTLGLNSTRSTSVPKLINKQKKKSENARGNSLFEALSQGSWAWLFFFHNWLGVWLKFQAIQPCDQHTELPRPEYVFD